MNKEVKVALIGGLCLIISSTAYIRQLGANKEDEPQTQTYQSENKQPKSEISKELPETSEDIDFWEDEENDESQAESEKLAPSDDELVNQTNQVQDIRWLKPYIGEMSDLFNDYQELIDNFSNEYIGYSINCSGYTSPRVGIVLNGEYSTLKAEIGLSYRDKDYSTTHELGLEFFDGDTGQQIGKTRRFSQGVEPEELNISVAGVNKLIIEVGQQGIHTNGALVTNGLFLEK